MENIEYSLDSFGRVRKVNKLKNDKEINCGLYIGGKKYGK